EGNHCRQVSTPLSTTDWTIRSSSSSCSGSSNTIESWISITRPIRSSSSPYPASVNMRSMILSDDNHQSLPNCARADWTRWLNALCTCSSWVNHLRSPLGDCIQPTPCLICRSLTTLEVLWIACWYCGYSAFHPKTSCCVSESDSTIP